MQEAETVYTSQKAMLYLVGQENYVRQENLVIVYGSKDRLMRQEKILVQEIIARHLYYM